MCEKSKNFFGFLLFCDVYCFGTSVAFFGLEFHFCAFFYLFTFKVTDVEKDIIIYFFSFDESVSFLVVEKRYCSFHTIKHLLVRNYLDTKPFIVGMPEGLDDREKFLGPEASSIATEAGV